MATTSAADLHNINRRSRPRPSWSRNCTCNVHVYVPNIRSLALSIYAWGTSYMWCSTISSAVDNCWLLEELRAEWILHTLLLTEIVWRTVRIKYKVKLDHTTWPCWICDYVELEVCTIRARCLRLATRRVHHESSSLRSCAYSYCHTRDGFWRNTTPWIPTGGCSSFRPFQASSHTDPLYNVSCHGEAMTVSLTRRGCPNIALRTMSYSSLSTQSAIYKSCCD